LSSYAFDSSVAGLFWTLAQGGVLVLPTPEELTDPARLAELIARRGVSHLLCVPSLLGLLLDGSAPGLLEGLETAIVAGEPCPPALPARLSACLPRAALHNEYGPTEATVWCTAYR